MLLPDCGGCGNGRGGRKGRWDETPTQTRGREKDSFSSSRKNWEGSITFSGFGGHPAGKGAKLGGTTTAGGESRGRKKAPQLKRGWEKKARYCMWSIPNCGQTKEEAGVLGGEINYPGEKEGYPGKAKKLQIAAAASQPEGKEGKRSQ